MSREKVADMACCLAAGVPLLVTDYDVATERTITRGYLWRLTVENGQARATVTASPRGVGQRRLYLLDIQGPRGGDATQ